MSPLPIPHLMPIRTMIVQAAIIVETSTSVILSHILDVPLNESILLGNTAQALSASSKVNLLLETAILTKDQKKLLIPFMELRNQCVHNGRFTTLEELFALPSISSGKMLLTKYPTTGNLENQYNYAITQLCEECIEIIKTATEATENRVRERLEVIVGHDVQKGELSAFHSECEAMVKRFEQFSSQGYDVTIAYKAIFNLVYAVKLGGYNTTLSLNSNLAKYVPRSIPIEYIGTPPPPIPPKPLPPQYEW